MREPLVHFMVLGAMLFAVDHELADRSDDPHTIVMGTAVDGEIRRLFTAARHREPDNDEMKALRERWLDNEVLYREGLALQVDRGDKAIRERVIFKALSVVNAGVKAPPADEHTLRQWFDARRSRYDVPVRFDFQEAVPGGDSAEATVRALVRSLNDGAAPDAGAALRVFKGRPHANLVQSYGEDFARALEQAAIGEWRALPTRGGWRAVRLDAVAAARPADFDALRAVVHQDWLDAVMAEQRTAAVRALTQKYTLKTE